MKPLTRLLLSLNLLALVFAASQAVPERVTLEAVRARGRLICGVNGELAGFSLLEADGRVSGFDADYCRALASVVLGDAEAVDFVTLTSQARFEALSSGRIDVLIRNSTLTSSRDTVLGLNFVQPTFYDGQGIMVNRDAGIRTLEDFGGREIIFCVQQGTTTELNLADQFRVLGIPYVALIFVNNTLAVQAYRDGLCDAFTTDKSGLAADGDPNLDLILDATLSKEPLGPAVRHGDDNWYDIVQWTVFATIQAEEWGITSENVEAITAYIGTVPNRYSNVREFLGTEGNALEPFGLDPEAFRRMIRTVGNYSEIYNRNLGPASATNIPRGLNRLWNNGGLLYAPPLRSRVD